MQCTLQGCSYVEFRLRSQLSEFVDFIFTALIGVGFRIVQMQDIGSEVVLFVRRVSDNATDTLS